MKPSIKLRLLLAATAAACGLAAAPVRADSPAAPAAQPASKAKAKWIKAAQKHNGSNIQLSYQVPANLSAGQTVAVQLRFAGITQDDASVRITAPAGMQLASANGSAALGTGMALPRGRTTELVLQVTPGANGLEYLNVFTAQGGRSSAQSIPLQVGNTKQALKTTGKPETTPSGEKVISMPSQ
jgi:hypothetical protein